MSKLATCKNIKVLHLLQNFRVGGLEKVVKELVINSGDKITSLVCAINLIGPFAQDIKDKGFKVFLIQSESEAKNLFQIVLDIRKLLSKEKIDVLHCHDTKAWFLGTVATLFFKNIKIVHTRHGFIEKPNKKLLFQLKILSFFCDKIIAVSPEIKSDMVSKQGIKFTKIEVIFNGINIDSFRPAISLSEAKLKLGFSLDHFIIGTVTRFFKIKNIEMQLDMVGRLKKEIPDLRLIIVAPFNSYSKTIEKEIRQRKLKKYVHLLGFKEDIKETLCALDLFVLTSFSEGTSMALLEAMAARRASVVSSVGGNVSLVIHNKNGMLFDVENLNEFCEDIMKLYKDKSLRKNLSKKAAESVKKFSIKAMTDNYSKIYLDKF